MTLIEAIVWLFRAFMLFCLLLVVGSFAFLVYGLVALVRNQSEPYDFWDGVGSTIGDGWEDEDWVCPGCGRRIEGFEDSPEHHIRYYHRRIAIGPEDSIKWKI